MGMLPFRAFVDLIDATLRDSTDCPDAVASEEQVDSATWIRGDIRAGVERADLSVRAWIGIAGHVAREFSEPTTSLGAERLGREFGALLDDLGGA